MVEIILFIIAIALLVAFLEWLGQLIGSFFDAVIVPPVLFVWGNIWLLLGVSSLLASIYYLIVYKPLQAEKLFQKYKDGLLSREEAIEKIADTFYNPVVEGLPSSISTQVRTKRVAALRKRLRAETELMDEIYKNIRSRG